MDTKELLKKVKRIEITTRGLSKQIFSGQYHSAFKGRGMAFSEVREYQIGDEIRTIDWNVTARFNEPYVKVFDEERELTVMLLVDVSASENFGTKDKLKKEAIIEIAAVLSFSAIQNNDKIGVIFFTDKIEKYIPPNKGKSHALRIIRDLIDFKPTNKKTDLNEALKFFINILKKRSTAFVLSDFESEDFQTSIKIANNRHDVTAIRVTDPRDEELPNIGFTKFLDPETEKVKWINTSRKKNRLRFKAYTLKKNEQLKDFFKKSNIDFVHIKTNESFIKPLIYLFKHKQR